MKGRHNREIKFIEAFKDIERYVCQAKISFSCQLQTPITFHYFSVVLLFSFFLLYEVVLNTWNKGSVFLFVNKLRELEIGNQAMRFTSTFGKPLRKNDYPCCAEWLICWLFQQSCELFGPARETVSPAKAVDNKDKLEPGKPS